jgi:Lon protease-like protein
VDPLCREVLEAIIERVGAERFPAPARLDDASWVGYRLAEVLPLERPVRQALLEMTDPGRRLERLRGLLAQHGLRPDKA